MSIRVYKVLIPTLDFSQARRGSALAVLEVNRISKVSLAFYHLFLSVIVFNVLFLLECGHKSITNFLCINVPG